MTKSEVAEILAVIDGIYPNFKVDDETMMVNAWHWALKDYSYQDISKSLDIYIKTNNTGFAPAVSQLIGLIHKEDDFQYPSESEAWTIVRRACERLDWINPDKEFNKLPEIIKEAVVSADNLKNWAQLDMGDFESVISSNFKRTYRAVVERSKEVGHMPPEIRERIENARKKMLTEGGLYARDDAAKQLTDSTREVSEEI